MSPTTDTGEVLLTYTVDANDAQDMEIAGVLGTYLITNIKK